VTVTEEGGTALVEVTSPSGIGSADVQHTGGKRPRQVVIRLHLKGLEEFQFAYGQTVVTASFRVAAGRLGECSPGGSSLDEAIAPGSPYWMR